MTLELFDALEKLSLNDLNPSSPEVIERQPTINIGTIGHVAHGKSTVVKAISGVQTIRFKNELERNITIKLGYANAKIFKCDSPDCPRPDCYKPMKSDKMGTFPCERSGCSGTMRLWRHISFVDCPGHDILMATMLNGAAVMDAALLLVAANETCPQPQTSEHLAAVEIMKLKNILILQNKIDLVKESVAEDQYRQIVEFIKGTTAEGSPIIPISGQLRYNIDAVCEYICNKIPIPQRDFNVPPKMIVIRSFDVNKPGAEVSELKGGVAGGSLLWGTLRVGDEIEVRPGIISKDDQGKFQCRPILSKVVSLFSDNNDLKFAVPGGLIGVGTRMDPTICRADRLVGQVLGAVGTLPPVFAEIDVYFYLLSRLLGVKSTDSDGQQTRVSRLVKGEIILINIGSTCTGGTVLAVKSEMAKIKLGQPVCTQVGEKIALSRRVDSHWRLIGWGKIVRGQEVVIEPYLGNSVTNTANMTATPPSTLDHK